MLTVHLVEFKNVKNHAEILKRAYKDAEVRAESESLVGSKANIFALEVAKEALEKDVLLVVSAAMSDVDQPEASIWMEVADLVISVPSRNVVKSRAW